ncbi:MAG: DUF3566 domain-containing protein [Rhodococcus sp. (in: high G+C Gram-positive bacteria)]|uniref:DUF3566 domain-containing protein n=1 Tax=Rhodococcus sp. TaxID=1831 RepID=UPI003BB7F40C
MSTPQGPNGAEKGSPAPKGPNGQEADNVPVKPDTAKPSSAKTQDVAPPADSPKEPPASSGPAAKPVGADERAEKPDPSDGDGKPAGSGGAGKAVRPNPTAQTTPTVRKPADKSATSTQSGAQRPAAGSQAPPWQRGQQAQSAPQSTPQTNLPGRGQSVDKAGTGNAGAQRGSVKPAGGAPRQSAPAAPTRPVVTGSAAPSAAKAKSAVIDGPTRHIERKDLAKDLPDLSTVKHPLPTATPVAAETAHAVPAASVAVTAVPMAGDPLRATVQVRRIDPWSMLKMSSVISLSLFFVWMVAVGLLYGILAGMGVWERLNSAFTDIVSESGGGGLISAGQVFGYATVIGLANTILLTAMATLGAFIYNLCTDLVGGVQVTLADPD